MSYGIADMVESLRRTGASGADDAGMMAAAEQALRKVMTDGSWYDERFRAVNPDDGYGDVLLHEEPDHSLAVFAIAWAPGFETPPHDHHTWVVIGTVEGEECNRLWERRSDGPGYQPARTVRVGAGDTLMLSGADIHTVHNETDALALSLHVYGMHPDHTTRSQYDARTGMSERYVSEESADSA